MTTRKRWTTAALMAVAVAAAPVRIVHGAPVCGTWEAAQGPDTSDAHASLVAIAAQDASSAWAVGSARKDGVPNPSPLVMRWDGVAWTAVPLPDLGVPGTGVAIEGIALAGGSPLVAGHYHDGSGNLTPLVLRMRGGFWQAEVVTMETAARSALLRDVAAGKAGDAFAVGESFSTETGTRPFAARHDGNAWHETRVASGATGRLVAVAVAGENDAWAVGHDVVRSQIAPEITVAAIRHWNGKGWVEVRHPARRPGTLLHDVVAISNKDIWAVGQDGATGLFLHYDGVAWTEHASPAAAGPVSVAAAGADDVWAVGAKAHYHFDGAGWTAYEAGTKPLESERRAIAASGGCALWTVGSYVDGGRSLPLFERMKAANAPEPPTAPSSVTATALAHDRAFVEWGAGAGDEIGFMVERCVGDFAACALAREGGFEPLAKVGTVTTSYTDAPLKPETDYSYRVIAFNNAGASSPSSVATIRTPAEPPPSPGPVPTGTVDPGPAPQGPTADPAEERSEPTPGPVPMPESEPTPLPVPVPDPESEPGPVPAPPSDPGPVPVPPMPLPVPAPSGEGERACEAVAARIVLRPGPRESNGDVQLEVVPLDASGKDLDVAGCLPVKWTLDSTAAELDVDATTRYAILRAKPGTYDVRARASNGVEAKAAITLE